MHRSWVLRFLLPEWNRERIFDPSFADLMADHRRLRPADRPVRRPTGAHLWLRALVLLVACWRIGWAERWHRLRGRYSLTRRVLPRFGLQNGSTPGGRMILPTQESPLESLARDIRFAWRALRARQGFAVVVIAILALGIGANTTIFTLLDKVVLRPLDFPGSSQLVTVTETNRASGEETEASVTARGFLDWRERARLFDGLVALNTASFNLAVDERTVQLSGLWVSGNFFDVLQMPPVGRGFTPLADRATAEVVISHGLWVTRFAGSQEAVGSELMLDGELFVVVGVVQPAFSFGTDVDIWAAADNDVPRPPVDTGQDYTADYGLGYLDVIGRLRDGVTLEQATEEMQAISAAISDEQPEDQSDRGVYLSSLHEAAVRGVRTPLIGLGFVLLIACANIASLMLARASGRRREMAIREAMGASRRRLFRFLVVESLILSLAGGALGVGLAFLGGELFVGLVPELPREIEMTLDARIVGFAIAVSALSGLLFGTAPAWQTARSDLRSTLGSTRVSEGAGAQRFRGLLVVAEIAIALVLVIGAGLMIKSFARLVGVEPGFDPGGVAVFSVALPDNRYAEDAKTVAFFDEALRQLRRLPGVESAGMVLALPFSGSAARISFFLEGQTGEEEGLDQRAVFQTGSSDYFRTMRIPMIAGRDFNDLDVADGLGVVIVNEELVRRHFPSDRDPLSMRLHFGDNDFVQVVGVVGNVRHDGYGGEQWPELYAPVRQVPWRFATFMVRGSGDVASLVPEGRQAFGRVDPLLTVHRALPLTRPPINRCPDRLGSPAPVHRAAPEHLRLFGAAARCARYLRRDQLLGRSAHQRDRHPDGPGRRRRLGTGPDLAPGTLVARRRRLARAPWRRCPDAAGGEPAARGHAARSGGVCDRPVGAQRGGAAGDLAAGAARDPHRSGRRVAWGLNGSAS